MLWEQSGQQVTLSAPTIAPDWQTKEMKGEALWPQPEGVATATAAVLGVGPTTVDTDTSRVPGEGESFS